MTSTVTPMPGLPPLPKCLRGILKLTNNQWKEMTTMHTMRTLVQQDHSVKYEEPGVKNRDSEYEDKKVGSLDVPVSRLQKEMVSLRQLDMSLLCQLWSLNESLHEYKQLLQTYDRDRAETNSECSSYSLDYPNDIIPSIDEAEAEDIDETEEMDDHIYENLTVLYPTDDSKEFSSYTNYSVGRNRYNSLPGHRYSRHEANANVSYC